MDETELGNVAGAQFMSIETVLPTKVERLLSEPKAYLRRITPREILRATFAMSAAYLGAAVLAPLVHRKSAWQGVNAIATAVPRFRRPARPIPFVRRVRVVRSFEPVRALASIGLVMAGALVLATTQRKLDGAARRHRVLRGVVPAVAALAFDRVVGARTFWPSMKRAVGADGLGLMYGALGTAAALFSKPEARTRVDASGGDIAAGVPAM